MSNKFNILGLILLGVIVLSLVFPYKEGLQTSTDQKDVEIAAELAQQDDESGEFVSDIIDQEAGKRIKGIEDGIDDDTTFVEVEVSEDKVKSIDTEVPNVADLPKTKLDAEIEKCNDVNTNKDCDLLKGSHCGYCLDTNMTVIGNKEGPLDHVCSKSGWVPPGPEVAANCTKMKDRYTCSLMQDCGDNGGKKSICGWCPIKAKGMVFERKDGGLFPKYDEDKCNWEYKGIGRVKAKWHGWNGKKDVRGAGDCDRDSDCPSGWKCGQRTAGQDNSNKERRLDGSLISDKSQGKQNRDYCYDPNHASLKGPLVPNSECATFNQKFPCMTKNMYTGPHSDACHQDLWKKSKCSGNYNTRLSHPDISSMGGKIRKTWKTKGYKKIYNEIQTYADHSLSNEYEKAKKFNKLCYGRDINPCDMKFINKSKGIKRPQVCIDKLWGDFKKINKDVTNNAKLDPKNISKWKGKSGSGVTKAMEDGLYYDWTPGQLVSKWYAEKSKADTHNLDLNSGNYSSAIAHNENIYGKQPPKLPFKKPCWKDFKERLHRSHKVTENGNGDTIYFRIDKEAAPPNSTMSDLHTNRTLLATQIGQKWGGEKKVTQTEYEKPYWPYWEFVKNSKDHYAKDKTWNTFRNRMVTVSGVQAPNSNTLIMEQWTDFTRVMNSWKINPSYTAHIPINGKCAACNLVPVGQCQQGCKKGITPDGPNNACPNNNQGKSPSSCIVPQGNVLTKKMFQKDDFPYWAFMRILTRNEKN